MKEWNKAVITLDKFVNIECDVLITKGTAYDMLLGLNVYLAIGGNLTPNFLKYNIKVDEKDRWGKIPLNKSPLSKK